jgi:hypothetical protein
VAIQIEGDIRSKIEWWLAESELHRERNESLQAYVCSWIAFNCYYARFGFENSAAVLKRNDLSRLNQITDADYLEWLASRQAFKKVVEDFGSSEAQSSTESIELPIISLLTKSRVPLDMAGDTRLITLATEKNYKKLLRILGTIRNNVFHGGRELDNERDQRICDNAARFMEKFVGFIKNETVWG